MARRPQVSGYRVELELAIAAPRNRVWSVYAQEVASWWPRGFCVTSAEDGMRFDAWPGGHLMERSSDGGGVLWATVIAVDPGRSVDFVAHFAARYGGPATSIHNVSFDDADDGHIVVRIVDQGYGLIEPGLEDQLRSGWNSIYSGLKRCVEAGGA